MKIPLKTLELRPKGHVVGCGVQGSKCLALDLSHGRGGKLSINWSLAGDLGDEAFVKTLSRKTGTHHFWVSPSEEGGLQVEAALAIEIPGGLDVSKGSQQDFFLTQLNSRFVNEEIVCGGLRVKGAGVRGGTTVKCVHNVGGGAIRDNVKRDYYNWYSKRSIRRPHIASTALALANAYLSLYPDDRRRAQPLRLVMLKGERVYRAILMDDWKYIDEVLLPRMEGDDANGDVIRVRMDGWIDYFRRQHPDVVADREIVPLVIAVKETAVSSYDHWDLWGEGAMEKIDMTEDVAQAILSNRDIAPIALGMALQGGC